MRLLLHSWKNAYGTIVGIQTLVPVKNSLHNTVALFLNINLAKKKKILTKVLNTVTYSSIYNTQMYMQGLASRRQI